MTGRPPEGDGVGYDSVGGTYHAVHDWDECESIALTVISAVSAVTNTPPLEMEPLFDAVDPDALNSLLRRNSDAATRSGVTVSFRFEGHEVTADASGEVLVDVSEPRP